MEKLDAEGSCLCGTVHWSFKGETDSATACNCTACRRYGALWVYGCLGQEIQVEGDTRFFDRGGKTLEFHFCANCGCVAYWLGKNLNEAGLRRIAVNVRLALDPEKVERLSIRHFDGLNEFDDLPLDGKCVKDLWF